MVPFFESENFASMFWNWTHTNIPDRQHSARFRKTQKVLYHSILLYSDVKYFSDNKFVLFLNFSPADHQRGQELPCRGKNSFIKKVCNGFLVRN